MLMRVKILMPIITVIAVLMTACHTGVDSTDRIEISRKERRLMQTTEADTLLNSAVCNTILANWQPGRVFRAVSDRTAYIFDASSTAADPSSLHLGGKNLLFCGTGNKYGPDGKKKKTIIFSDGTARYIYDTGRRPPEADSIRADRLPLLIDMTMIEKADSILRGRTLWTLTPDRYDSDGSLRNERKFMEITVDSVTPGNESLPFRIFFTTHKGVRYVLAGLPPATAHTLTFPSLFSLRDIRSDYMHIYPEIWENICNGIVTTGMTKEECRLALGNPSEIDRSHNWSSLQERWSYPGGVVLLFEDGRLINFRK